MVIDSPVTDGQSKYEEDPDNKHDSNGGLIADHPLDSWAEAAISWL